MFVAEQDAQVHGIVAALQQQLETARTDNVLLREQWGEAWQVCTYVYVNFFMYSMYVYICMYVFMYECAYVCMYICMYIHSIHTCIHVCIYTAYIHVYVHINIERAFHR